MRCPKSFLTLLTEKLFSALGVLLDECCRAVCIHTSKAHVQRAIIGDLGETFQKRWLSRLPRCIVWTLLMLHELFTLQQGRHHWASQATRDAKVCSCSSGIHIGLERRGKLGKPHASRGTSDARRSYSAGPGTCGTKKRSGLLRSSSDPAFFTFSFTSLGGGITGVRPPHAGPQLK